MYYIEREKLKSGKTEKRIIKKQGRKKNKKMTGRNRSNFVQREFSPWTECLNFPRRVDIRVSNFSTAESIRCNKLSIKANDSF